MNVNNIIRCLWILFLVSACQSNPHEANRFPSEELVVSQMDSLVKASELPGFVAIAVNNEGESITYTFGNAIWNEESPIRANNIFRIASMTKLITSIAALQLVEKDSLELDEDLTGLLPEMASIPILTTEKEYIHGKRPITLRSLLTHTSGFGYFFTDSLLAEHDATDWNYEDLPRRFEAGSQFLYGTSTDWVGKVVEKISGRTLEEYFRENITGPLGMNRTWYNVPDSLKNEIVSYGHMGDDGTKELSEYPDRIPENETQFYSGGGGMFSSPEDYTKLLYCLLNNGIFEQERILQEETVNQLFTEQLEGISMDIEQNYFQQGLCCNFKGLIKPTSNWGLAGLIDTETTAYGRKEGTLLWGGIFNTYWFIDKKSGIAGSIYTQYLPFNHPATTSLFDKFSQIIYQNYNHH
ncbi:serine hydrolase domain-containing protein [Fulvivirga sedimenti]|uniref:Beta-lactamase family protein n=1 Tax=Fulvivirga sedimenti TaxID=2879465 RepID=A0A9X1HLW2_9BACT|nr:serine hydrolase domain-containing protein [Fulvivirga sedimenti]MCA6074634.1 beta-lactamase family protein [Fulvivirga sedimenti]MCA6075811.1 beta-lactamase family protein [Fulvivirga sedimenti]MCA6076939.1 beta-lactamase family protein [Fulvivirga sedimenti]